jgi:hypothetical protein
MASTDAKPIPQKNVAYRVTFPIFDADGDLVTGATGLDSEVSKDGGAFADCTNEATEIGSSGIYYLDLTSTEMNADTVAIIVKTSSSGAKTTPIVMYPEEAGDMRVNVTQVNGTTQTAGDLAAMITAVDDYVDTEVAAIKAKTDNLPASPANEATLTTIASYIDTEVAAIKAKTDNLPASPAAVGSAMTLTAAYDAAKTAATQISVDTIDDFLDMEIAAIKSKTDNLPSDPADASDIAASFTTVNTKLDTIDDFVDTEVSAIKTVTDKLDTALELDGAVYRYTTNALEQAPAGGVGGSGLTADQTAAAVWNAKVDTYIADRSFGSKIGLHLPVVSPDIDYKRIKKVVKEEIATIPAPEKVDLEPIVKGFESVLTEIRSIEFPDIPETDLTPLKDQIEALQKEVKAIVIPETDLSETNSLITSKNDVLDLLADAQEEIKSGQLERIREFFEGGLDKITADVASIKKTIDGTQLVVFQDRPKDGKKEKSTTLEEYLNL